jgi:hypothetical protein
VSVRWQLPGESELVYRSPQNGNAIRIDPHGSNLGALLMTKPGPSCPVEYLYSARDFRAEPSFRAETVYVVGGLYGNLDALHAILRMRDDEAKRGTHVALVFNGDHNWFDVDPDSFREINHVALESVSIRGNVEAEIAAPTEAGCGCNYPDYVNPEYVARSNAIMGRLQAAANDFPSLRSALGALPLWRTIEVGAQRIGIVHGDAEMLSGWAFAAERLSPIGKCCSGDEATAALTPRSTIDRFFRESGVTAFASTHTCLAHARDFEVDGKQRLIINNGAAGLPNFADTSFGLVTRISVDPAVPAESLYGLSLGGVRFDALPVRFDQPAWIGRFLANWAPGSPAFEAYFNRILSGPDFDLDDAVAGQVMRASP